MRQLSQKLNRQEIEWSKEIEVLTIDYDRLVEARGALANAPTSPFVWDIAFVEIFSDDKRGFDIVIGNPPYVRQEEHRRSEASARRRGDYNLITRKLTKQSLPDPCNKPSRVSSGTNARRISDRKIRLSPSLTNSTPEATSTSISTSTGFPSSIPKAPFVSSPPTHGWMSFTVKTFRNSSSSTATSSRLSTISRGAPSPPPM